MNQYTHTTNDLQNNTAKHKAICKEPVDSYEVLHVSFTFSIDSMNSREEYTS